MLLLALLVIASASDYYGYDRAPEVEKPEAKTDYKPHLTKPDYDEETKPKTDYYNNGYGPAPKVEKVEAKADYKHLTKPDYVEETKPKTDYYNNGYDSAPTVEKVQAKTDSKPHPTKPDYDEESESNTDNYDNGYGPAPKVENPKPKTDYKVEKTNPKTDYNVEKPNPTEPNYYDVPKPKGKDVLPTTIAVQGVVLCKSGSSYSPIQGNAFVHRCNNHIFNAYRLSINVLKLVNLFKFGLWLCICVFVINYV